MRGISMYDSSSVSTLFSSLGSSKSTGSGMFGINLSEYASIRSGSYGKLMRSYFSMDSTKSTSKSDDSTKNTIEDSATTTSTSNPLSSSNCTATYWHTPATPTVGHGKTRTTKSSPAIPTAQRTCASRRLPPCSRLVQSRVSAPHIAQRFRPKGTTRCFCRCSSSSTSSASTRSMTATAG